jgi:DNA-directed RNA polymerase subunit alpha
LLLVTDKKTELEMEIEIDRGLGYVPVESRECNDDEREIGVIAIDAIYTPVKRVNYEVENMRVGKRTDYDKITLEIVTDGSITPTEAFEKSVSILVGQFYFSYGSHERGWRQ